jgi:hypothetical protein
MPKILSSTVIGTFAGQPMHRWIERDDNGAERTFEDYVTSFYSPMFDRHIGLTLVRECTAEQTAIDA